MINIVTIPYLDKDTEVAMLKGIILVDEMLEGCQTMWWTQQT